MVDPISAVAAASGFIAADKTVKQLHDVVVGGEIGNVKKFGLGTPEREYLDCRSFLVYGTLEGIVKSSKRVMDLPARSSNGFISVNNGFSVNVAGSSGGSGFFQGNAETYHSSSTYNSSENNS